MLREHSFDDIDPLGKDQSRILPGDPVGWFFDNQAHGIAIAIDEKRRRAIVMWSVPPRELPYIDEQGTMHTKVGIQPVKPVEFISITFKIEDEDVDDT